MRKQIESIRFNQGLTKSQLCSKSGISEGTYYRFLKGADITLSVLERIFSALNVSIDIKENE